ncbi:unnamed protein product [Urochloa decumbens]|uniref:Uncharacterized protein n=1 Tax=Urochloa decumbens TaxID=240449 RepID=A0ABC9GFC9_9POAL
MFALFFISSAQAASRKQFFQRSSYFLNDGTEKATQHISTWDYADPSPPPVPVRPPRPPPANKQFREAEEGTGKIINQHISTLDYADPSPPPVPIRPPIPPPANKQFTEADDGAAKITQHISTLDYADPSPPPVPVRPPIPPPANKQFPEAVSSHTSGNHHETRDNMPQVDPPYSQQMTPRALVPGGPFESPSLGTNLV